MARRNGPTERLPEQPTDGGLAASDERDETAPDGSAN